MVKKNLTTGKIELNVTYLKCMFFIDLISFLPPAVIRENRVEISQFYYRTLILMQLTRSRDIGIYMKTFFNNISLKEYTKNIIKYVLKIMYIMHFSGCLYFFVAEGFVKDDVHVNWIRKYEI